MSANRSVPALLYLAALIAAPLCGCGEPGSRSPGLPGWWNRENALTSPEPGSRRTQRPTRPRLSIFGPSATSGAAREGNYTILLAVCRGPGSHVKQAKHYKQATEQHARWENLFIVHGESHSLVYWGRYRTVADAQPNLKKATAYRTPLNVPVFSKAIVVPIPGSEDLGPPEWKLTSAPPKYLYSVLVAEFYDVVEADYVGRRKFAVDYCRQLRKQGLPAYYKHDPGASIVTVGLFERSAVQDVRRGKRVERVIRDRRIKELFKRFPNMAVNGRQRILTSIDPRTRKQKKVPVPTYLMRIPREPVGPTASASRGGRTPAVQGLAVIACELKVVHVPDGAVVAAASAQGRSDELGNLARLLVQKLEKPKATKGKSLAVASFRDRTGTQQAAYLARELAFTTMGALLEEGWSAVKERVDLRGVLPEQDLDNPAAVKTPGVRKKLGGLDYVVLGGVAVLPPEGS